MAAGELGVATPRRPANARRRPVACAADAPRWRSAEEFVAVGICLREREERGRGERKKIRDIFVHKILKTQRKGM